MLRGLLWLQIQEAARVLGFKPYKVSSYYDEILLPSGAAFLFCTAPLVDPALPSSSITPLIK